MRLIVVLSVISAMLSFSEACGREWQDTTGNFTIEAEFVKQNDEYVQLKRPDGTTVNVQKIKLCDEDRKILAVLEQKRSFDWPPDGPLRAQLESACKDRLDWLIYSVEHESDIQRRRSARMLADLGRYAHSALPELHEIASSESLTTIKAAIHSAITAIETDVLIGTDVPLEPNFEGMNPISDEDRDAEFKRVMEIFTGEIVPKMKEFEVKSRGRNSNTTKDASYVLECLKSILDAEERYWAHACLREKSPFKIFEGRLLQETEIQRLISEKREKEAEEAERNAIIAMRKSPVDVADDYVRTMLKSGQIKEASRFRDGLTRFTGCLEIGQVADWTTRMHEVTYRVSYTSQGGMEMNRVGMVVLYRRDNGLWYVSHSTCDGSFVWD